MKKAVIVENKGCATWSIGAACLVDDLFQTLKSQVQQGYSVYPKRGIVNYCASF